MDGWVGGYGWVDESQGGGGARERGRRERERGRRESSLTLVVHALLFGVHDI